MGILGKLADNGLLGCRRVVGANSRKWGHLRVSRARFSAPVLPYCQST